jgi:hypothetical protein
MRSGLVVSEVTFSDEAVISAQILIDNCRVVALFGPLIERVASSR